MRGPRAILKEDAKYGGKDNIKSHNFNHLLPPYFLGAVRSFGEYRAERDEIRPRRRVGGQELRAKKLANIGDSRSSDFGERDLPKG